MSPRRKGAEPLARGRIVEAAIGIIDKEGLEGLSMRRLGAVLGVNPMAAYYHVPNKAALYDLVLEALMAEVDMSGVDPGAPPTEQVKQAARAYRKALLAHPRAIPVLAMRSLRTAAALRPVEPLLGILYLAGLSPGEALAAVDCIAQYILGGTVGFYHRVVDSETAEQREFEELDPAEFPNLSRMFAEGRYAGFDEEFEFGLDAMVRGLLPDPRRGSKGPSPS
jgi:TetR/AcrR family tetracycline transcriptional repressor